MVWYYFVCYPQLVKADGHPYRVWFCRRRFILVKRELFFFHSLMLRMADWIEVKFVSLARLLSLNWLCMY